MQQTLNRPALTELKSSSVCSLHASRPCNRGIVCMHAEFEFNYLLNSVASLLF